MTDRPAPPAGPEEIDTVARVRWSGNSYCVFITKELKELGLGPGDMVRMKLRRLE